MREITLRTWDDTPQTTQDFSIITKMTDLGEPLYEKSILGFYINVINNTASPDNKNVYFSYNVKIEYREKDLDDFKFLWKFTGAHMEHKRGNIYLKHMLSTNGIFRVNNIQLRISSSLLKGDFGINDFGLVYREYRSASSSNLDEK